MKTNEMIYRVNRDDVADGETIARTSVKYYDDPENSLSAKPTRQRGLRIALCTGGEARVNIGGKQYHVSPGLMTIQLPGTLFCIDYVSPQFEAHEFFIPKESIRDIPVDLKKISAIFALLPKAPVYRLDEGQQEEFDNFFTLTLGMQKRGGTYRTQSLQGVMVGLIYFACEVIDQNGTVIDEQINAMRDNDRKNYYFIKFLDLLGRHCIQERSVGFYADKMFITPKYLSTVIKEISGRSASEWITEFVMVEAKMRLQTSDNNVSEIAYQLNFSNISFFGKFFKRHTGMSPSDFKRSCSRSA